MHRRGSSPAFAGDDAQESYAAMFQPTPRYPGKTSGTGAPLARGRGDTTPYVCMDGACRPRGPFFPRPPPFAFRMVNMCSLLKRHVGILRVFNISIR